MESGWKRQKDTERLSEKKKNCTLSRSITSSNSISSQSMLLFLQTQI